MNANRLHLFALLALTALSLGLTGCITGTSAPSSFYILAPTQNARPVEAPAAAGSRKLLIVLGPVTVAPYLDRPQIVSRGSGVRVSLAEFDRWAEPLDQSLIRTLAEDVARLTADSAMVVPGRDEEDADARVVVDVVRFDGALGGEAVLVAWWSIRSHDGHALNRGRADYRQNSGSSYESLVEAQSTLAGKLAQDIATAVNALGPQKNGASGGRERALK